MPSTDPTSLLLEEDLVATFIAEAEGLQREVLRLAAEGSPHCPSLEPVFAKPMREIRSFRIQPLERGAFTFDAATGRFVINQTHLLALIKQVDDDVRATNRHGYFVLDEDEIHPLRREVFRLHLLHETSHLPQGLGEHSAVTALKKIAGEEFMADMDLVADKMAASANAALVAGPVGIRADYLDKFKQSLFFIGHYSWPVFRFTMERPPKMGRAMGIAFGAARLARTDLNQPNLADFEKVCPLDACVTVRVAHDYSSALIVLNEPEPRVVSIALDDPARRFQELATRISDGDFLGAVDTASHILEDLKIAF